MTILLTLLSIYTVAFFVVLFIAIGLCWAAKQGDRAFGVDDEATRFVDAIDHGRLP